MRKYKTHEEILNEFIGEIGSLNRIKYDKKIKSYMKNISRIKILKLIIKNGK